MDVPSRWWTSAESRLTDPEATRERFYTLLRKHPDPASLIRYLNERRFILLLEILDQSECLRKFLLNHPEDFQKTIPRLWYRFKEKEDYLRELRRLVSDTMDDSGFSETLAYYRHRELMRIFAKELLGTAKTEDILREYSYLADALIEVAYERALNEAVDRYGEPRDERGNRVTGAVIGLGKLGSEELNFYSDIDLIFIHSSDKGSVGKVSLNEFFRDVFQKVVRILSTDTAEGKPYEVDLDLRPFGKTGPISMSLRSAELYYESYGRVWERFALLRARPVAGDRELGERFMKEVVRPFVYTPADYKLVEEIRLMKKRVEAEAKKSLMKGFNVKTGEGGIREVEFTVQALTILLGSRFPFLRERNTFRGIWKLSQRGVFSDEETLFLERAYSFLRTLENRIQVEKCIKTHVLRDEDIPKIAKFLGMDEGGFIRKLEEVRSGVKEIFESLVPERKGKDLQPVQVALITGDMKFGSFVLKERGFKDPQKSFNLLLSYIYGKEGTKLSDREKDKFISLVERIVDLSSRSSDPDETLRNFDKFFSNPTGRKVILSDPKEDFLGGLFNVFSLSPTLSSLVGKNPDLVEDVLTLYQEYPTVNRLEEEFTKYEETLDLSPENLFRRFKKVWEIRVGLVYLMGDRSPESLKKLFSSLSTIAEFLLKKLWERLELKHERVLIYSLGKLGSREMTFRSDLDLVFCAGDPSAKNRIVEKVQRMVRFITAHTPEGYLYDVDFRLRPLGTRGELVPTIDFYRRYFLKEARTWERIAWTRARFITGDGELMKEFEEVVENFLFGGPWGERERRDVYEMRLKLQDHSKRGRDLTDIKLGPGGIFDAEFLVQYLLIKEGVRESSMIGGLERLMKIYPSLREVYRSFLFLRQVETHLRLLKEGGSSVIHRQDVPRLARSLNMDEAEFVEDLKKSMRILRDTFLEFLGP